MEVLGRNGDRGRVRGHPQGVPLRWMVGLGRKLVVARARAPTRGAPTGGD